MSENNDSLQESLDLYNAQLRQIKDALSVASEDQKADLEQVAQSLEEIIELTQSSILNESQEDDENSLLKEESHLEEELEALEGVKCRVPFKYEWGGLGYHNAIILGSEMDEDKTVHVKTVFMHPTTKKMQPCPYFLEGNCKYSDEKCHYSHGHVVRMDQLQDYCDPDYNKITEGCTVLAKYKDELWYRSTVEDIIKETEFSVKFSHCNDVLLLNLHSVYPLEDDEDDSSSELSANEDDSQFTPRFMAEQSAGLNDGSFGYWEKHTRGIGSSLMAKMGYVHGSGLGKEGEGRVDPVEAIVFPPGRSLDRCMELREKAGNEDMMTVEKKLERQKAKTEHRLKQMASATENQQSVFDFINSKLTHNTSQDSTKAGTSQSRRKMESADLSRLSREKLNVQSLQIGEEILKTERELTKIKGTLQRQIDRGDLASVSHVRTRLAEKEKELDRLRASDRTIVNEQKQRKSSSKLTIF